MENEPRNIWKCSRKKCGYIGHEDTWESKPHPSFKDDPNVTQLVCPRCGNNSFTYPKPGEIARPTVVCLCGSSRFYEAYQQAEYSETMAGRIYLSIGFYPHCSEQVHGEGVGHTSVEKIALDELHKRKIDLADEVFVLNVGGYIGDSTRSEVEYAKAKKKKVRWLETPVV